MKKLFILVFALLFIFAEIFAQDFKCVSCYHNNVDFSKYASAIGSANAATGSYSFVGGFRSQATGAYSYAFGNSNFATGESATALGIGSRATGKGSFVVGWQSESLRNYSAVIGSFSKANGVHSIVIGHSSESSGDPGYIFGSNCKIGNSSGFLFGNRLKTENKNTFIIGDGKDTLLTNNVEYSLNVGFKSNLPTLHVGPSAGPGRTGKIGIGNVTAPEAKLHIRADATEHARIKLEYTGSDKEAAILFGDGTQSITTSHEMPFTFKSGQNDYYFENGNVGIGTNTPDAKLHLFSNANNSRLRLEIFDNETSNKSWDFNNANGTLKLQFGSTTSGKPTMTDKMVITSTGSVGIGTTNIPTEKLEVAGNIAAEAIRVAGLQLVDNNQGAGKLLQSNEDGNATWVEPEILSHWKLVDGRLITSHITGVRVPEGATVYGTFQVGKKFTIWSSEGSTNKVIANNYRWQNKGSTRIYDGAASSISFGDSTGNITLNATGYGMADTPIIWQKMTFTNQGQLGIGTTDFGEYKLAVAGKIIATELTIVDNVPSSDYVFSEEYNLRTLAEVEDYVWKNRHLPEVPSAREFKENGYQVGTMDDLLLRKVEELTLYLIAQQKLLEKQQTLLEKQQAEIEQLKAAQE